VKHFPFIVYGEGISKQKQLNESNWERECVCVWENACERKLSILKLYVIFMQVFSFFSNLWLFGSTERKN
jgi:hypothetical protein